MDEIEEKIKKINETLIEFFDSLGENDIYKQIFLEVFFEEILKKN